MRNIFTEMLAVRGIDCHDGFYCKYNNTVYLHLVGDYNVSNASDAMVTLAIPLTRTLKTSVCFKLSFDDTRDTTPVDLIRATSLQILSTSN